MAAQLMINYVRIELAIVALLVVLVGGFLAPVLFLGGWGIVGCPHRPTCGSG